MHTFLTTLIDTDGVITKFHFAFVDISMSQLIRLTQCVDIVRVETIDELTGEVMYYSSDKELYIAPDWEKFFYEKWDEIE